jgi:rotatin
MLELIKCHQFSLQSLLSLLCVPSTESLSVAINATNTLYDMAKCIQTRIFFYQDPSVYSPKQGDTIAPLLLMANQFHFHFSDFTSASNSASSSFLSHSLGSSDSRPSVVGHSDTRPQGDGQDGDHSSS